MKKLLLTSTLLVAVAGVAMAQAPVQIIPAPGRFPTVVAYARSTAQTAAVASVVAFTPAADGTFEISANVLATTSTTYSFDVTVAFTDESNTARTIKLNMMLTSGSVSNSAALTNVNGPLFMGLPMHIRCKAATAITVATAGTFTTVTYNVEGVIKQVQ